MDGRKKESLPTAFTGKWRYGFLIICCLCLVSCLISCQTKQKSHRDPSANRKQAAEETTQHNQLAEEAAQHNQLTEETAQHNQLTEETAQHNQLAEDTAHCNQLTDYSVVQVYAGERSGSGVMIELEGNKAVVATAAHVLDGITNSLQVQVNFNNYILICQKSWISKEADIAFLQLELQAESNYEEVVSAAKVDKEIFDRTKSGDTLVVKGFEEGQNFISQVGTVLNTWIYAEDFQQFILLGKAEAFPGMSGGGVFTVDGYLLGILCGKTEDSEIAVLPLSVMLSQLQSMKSEEEMP
jgi:S1-C subfamily serine protease